MVVRLLNNTIIVGEAVYTPEDILISNPLEVSAKPIHDNNGKIVGEQMVLRPLLIMTAENNVVIDTYNVLYSNVLDEKLIRTYEEMVNTVYSRGLEYDGNAFINEEESEEYTKEEAEYMKEVLDGLLDKDKTFH